VRRLWSRTVDLASALSRGLRKRWRQALALAMLATGGILVVVAAALIYLPAGIALAGMGMLAAGFLLDLGDD